MCDSLEVMPCGNQALHSFVLLTLFIPVALMRRLSSLALINSVIMTATCASIVIIIYYSINIANNTEAENFS